MIEGPAAWEGRGEMAGRGLDLFFSQIGELK